MSTALQPRPGPATLIPFGLGSAHPVAWGSVLQAAWSNRHAAAHALDALQTPCTHCATSGVHLCRPRLEALEDLHRPPLVPFDVRDRERLLDATPAQLRALGRIRTPLRLTRQGFETLTWDEALKHGAPRGVSVWAPATQGLSDEVYAEIQRVADHLAFPPAPPVPYAVNTEELVAADRIVIWGVPLHRWAPDLLRHLARARRAGARVIAVGRRDPAMEAHRFPNTLRGAIFGETAVDTWFHCDDAAAVIAAVQDPSRDLRVASGLAKAHLEHLQTELQAPRVTSLAPTLHPALVKLHEERGWTGVGAGLMRVAQGHGIEAAANLGLVANTPAEADWCGVFGDTLPVPAARRVFADTHLRPAMLGRAEEVIVLPIQPITDQRGGAWISADCRVFASASAGRFGGTRARAAWSVPGQLVAAGDPSLTGDAPSTIATLRARLQQRPAYANTSTLQPGGWARIVRA